MSAQTQTSYLTPQEYLASVGCVRRVCLRRNAPLCIFSASVASVASVGCVKRVFLRRNAPLCIFSPIPVPTQLT